MWVFPIRGCPLCTPKNCGPTIRISRKEPKLLQLHVASGGGYDQYNLPFCGARGYVALFWEGPCLLICRLGPVALGMPENCLKDPYIFHVKCCKLWWVKMLPT